jgi:hypothetical protein
MSDMNMSTVDSAEPAQDWIDIESTPNGSAGDPQGWAAGGDYELWATA